MEGNLGGGAPGWQQPNAAGFWSSKGAVYDYYTAIGQQDQAHYYRNPQPSQLDAQGQHNSYLQTPSYLASPNHQEYGMRIRGAAGQEQTQHAESNTSSPLLAQSSRDQTALPSDGPSQESFRGGTDLGRTLNSLNGKINEQHHHIKKQDRYINEQQRFINRLTAEKQILAKELGDTTNHFNEQLEQTANHQSEHSYGFPALDTDLGSDDELQALDFPETALVTPVEQRLQALGADMNENDRMEEHQHLVASKYLRYAKNIDQSSWSQPLFQTKQWSKYQDEPAFAEVGDGRVITFDVLQQRMQDLAASPSLYQHDHYYQDYRIYDEPPEHHLPGMQYPAERRLSNEQEDLLSALGVSGMPKPVSPYMPKPNRYRERSESPRGEAQEVQRRGYRQRTYESYRPDRCSPRLPGDERGTSSKINEDPTAVQDNISLKYENNQSSKNRRKGRGKKGKGKQNHYYNAAERI